MTTYVANIEVECPYCGKSHKHRLEYGKPDDKPIVVEVDDREDKDNGED